MMSLLMVTEHAALPLQPPVQPVKTEPLPGVGVRLTFVFFLKPTLQVAPQFMPEGDEVIVPVPEPEDMTLRAALSGARMVAMKPRCIMP